MFELQYGWIFEFEMKLEKVVENENKEILLMKNWVMDVEIVDVFLCWIGIFVFKMFEGECDKLL